MGSLGRQRAATSTKLSLMTIEWPSDVRFCSLHRVRKRMELKNSMERLGDLKTEAMA
jgi:hypothetical protein